MSDMPKFLIYDQRYLVDEESATVMDTATSKKEAIRAARDHGGIAADCATGEVVS